MSQYVVLISEVGHTVPRIIGVFKSIEKAEDLVKQVHKEDSLISGTPRETEIIELEKY